MDTVALGYLRVSSEQQAGEKQTSLADQRTAITALAARLQAPLSRVFEDAGISGATVAKRPGLRALLAFCAAHPRDTREPGFVVVLNDSRFGRFDDPDEAAALRFQLKRDGWLVRFAEADESNDPTARHVMRAIGSAQASEYRRNLRANSTRGRIGTTKQGYWSTREPFGFRRAVVFPPQHARVMERGMQKARGEKIKLVPGPADEVAIVHELFARYAAGGTSMRSLCRWLNTEPAACAGRQPWHVVTVKIVLQNHAYVGAIPARRRTAERMERGDFFRQAPEYVVWDAHEPLIDRVTFDRVQAQLNEQPTRGDVFDYRVRGLVFCSTCGEPFMGGGLGGIRKSTGTHAHFYVCQGGRDRRCPPRAACVTSHLLEDAVIREVAAHVAAQIAPSALRAAFGKRLGAKTLLPVRDPAKDRQRIEARRDRLVTAIEAGMLTAAEAQPRLEAIRAELLALETAPAVAPAVLQGQLDSLVARGHDLVSLAALASGAELRTLLRPWIDGLTFDKQTRVLTLRLRTVHARLPVQTLLAGGLHEQVTTRRAKVGAR